MVNSCKHVNEKGFFSRWKRHRYRQQAVETGTGGERKKITVVNLSAVENERTSTVVSYRVDGKKTKGEKRTHMHPKGMKVKKRST